MHLQYLLSVIAAKEGNTINAVIGQIKKNTPSLKDKTLLVLSQDLDKGVTEEEIKKKYPFDLKVVSEEEIEKAFISNDPKTAVFQLIAVEFGGGTIFAKVVTDTYEGKIYYSEYISTGPTLNGSHLGGTDIQLKPKNFADLGKE